MSRYTPLQRAFLAFLSVFLLLLMLLWFVMPGDEVGLGYLAWTTLKPSLLVGVIAWIACSISDLRYQVAVLRAELERLKSKE